MGSKSSAPPTPDYTSAAQATAAGNRVNQVTPYGNLTYSQGNSMIPDTKAYQQALQTYNSKIGQQNHPSSDGLPMGVNPGIGAAPKQSNYMMADPNAPWTATTSLSPEQQQLYNQNTQLSQGLMGLANQGMGAAQNVLDHPLTMADLPASAVNPGQTGQDALMSRFQPMIDQSNNRLTQQLANQGVMAGSDAYNNAWRPQNQSNNDLRMQAALNGINVGQNAQNQQFQLQNSMQMQPINLINALRTGNQVQNPQFTSTPAGPDYNAAAQNTANYNLGTANVQNASQNSLMGGLFGLGSAALMGPAGGALGSALGNSFYSW